MVAAVAISNTVENELYTCSIDLEERTITITTDLGAEVARRVAEFEAERSHVSISLIFGVENQANSRVYIFRLKHGGCLEDDGNVRGDSDPYKDLVVKSQATGIGCPHSKRGSPQTCSLCQDAREKAELVALIKAGKL